MSSTPGVMDRTRTVPGRGARHTQATVPWRRVRRIVLAAVVISLIPAAISYLRTITGTYNVSWSIESVEWLRNHGANGLVSQVEDWYYTLTAPAKGGPALATLPQAGLEAKNVAHPPPDIKPVIRPALHGEGVWHPASRDPRLKGSIFVATFRSEADYPRLVAGVAWINSQKTRLSYVPGIQEPPSLPNRGPAEVPGALRGRLAATFNGGFPLSTSNAGLVVRGHTIAPMVNGIGTLVEYRSGKVGVVSWHGGPSGGPKVLFAKQNLPLIIDHGKLNPNLSDGPEWGATVGNAIRVWRSGVGIDHHGNLLYAAANTQTVGTLAAILRRAGAVRALELDINETWTSFITYARRNAGDPSNLLPDMVRSPDRYLTPDDRDFFAVYAKGKPPGQGQSARP
jgi:hypothetical protein